MQSKQKVAALAFSNKPAPSRFPPTEKGGAAAAVSALTAKAKLAGMWREKVDQHNTGSMQYERIERVIVEHTSNNTARPLRPQRGGP